MPSPSDTPILVRRFDTPIGAMLGGATEAGICLCEFVDRDEEEAIVGHLEEKQGRTAVWESCEPRGSRPLPVQASHLRDLESQLAEYFAGTRRRFHLPLDLAGTPWQETVWTALLEIPFGTTISYGELATRLGKFGGSRAVGRANGDNRVAIVVPCHRVVQADGGLRGYGGGIHRKRWLLDLEAGSRQLSF